MIDDIAPSYPFDAPPGAKLIVSNGGGTNSAAMLIGLHERGIRPDAITFADTGGEKPWTYEHLAIMQSWCQKVRFPPIDTVRGTAPQQIKDGTLEAECLRLGQLPAKAYGFSSCSAKWKLEPQQRYDKAFAAAHGITLAQIVRLIGFDADEESRVTRARSFAHRNPTRQAFPLYDWGWAREECVEAISRAGLPQPGKSACFFCPSTKKTELLELRQAFPELLARAVEMERIALAGEGRAPATTGKGLGRSFGWAQWLREYDAAAAKSCLMSDAGVPEIDCGCYDG